MITIEENKVIFSEHKLYIKNPAFLLDYLYALIRHSRNQELDLLPDKEFFEFVKCTNYVFSHYQKLKSFCEKFNNYMFLNGLDGKEMAVMINYLSDLEVLEHILPELTRSKFVGQNKKNSDILYWHIIKLIEIVPNNGVQRWAALLHDLGKYYTEKVDNEGDKHYYYHEYVSYLLAKNILYRFNVKDPERTKILDIVRYHMLPLNYQRKPDWDTNAFLRYIEKCSPNGEDVALFALHDKMSSNNNPEYLKPLYKFYSYVRTLNQKANKVIQVVNVEKVSKP